MVLVLVSGKGDRSRERTSGEKQRLKAHTFGGGGGGLILKGEEKSIGA